MKSITTKSGSSQPVADTAVYLFDDWFDPIEAAVRDRVRGFIQAMIEGELDEKLLRPRYGRRPKSLSSVDDGGIAVRGIHRHDLCGHARGDRATPQGLHPQVAAAPSPYRRLPRGSRRPLVHLHTDRK